MTLAHSIAMFAVAILCAGCSHFDMASQHGASAPTSAEDLMIHYGCPTCHVIPHVPGAVGKVGPSLDELAQRSYLAGTLQNSPENLVHWIQHPQPDSSRHGHAGDGVTSADAVRLAAFQQTNH